MVVLARQRPPQPRKLREEVRSARVAVVVGGDEYQALDEVGARYGELLGDGAAHGEADDGGARNVEMIEQAGCVAGEVGDGVGRGRLSALARVARVDQEQAPPLAKPPRDGPPGEVAAAEAGDEQQGRSPRVAAVLVVQPDAIDGCFRHSAILPGGCGAAVCYTFSRSAGARPLSHSRIRSPLWPRWSPRPNCPAAWS